MNFRKIRLPETFMEDKLNAKLKNFFFACGFCAVSGFPLKSEICSSKDHLVGRFLDYARHFLRKGISCTDFKIMFTSVQVHLVT